MLRKESQIMQEEHSIQTLEQRNLGECELLPLLLFLGDQRQVIHSLLDLGCNYLSITRGL